MLPLIDKLKKHYDSMAKLPLKGYFSRVAGKVKMSRTKNSTGITNLFGRSKSLIRWRHPSPLYEKVYAILDRKHSFAKPGFNRWLIPPMALAIHLSIGMAYGFSVFWGPLTTMLDSSVNECPNLLVSLFSTLCQWRQFDVVWIFGLFFVFLGSSAAIRGAWLERVGPRYAGVEAALCWGGGLIIAGVGVALHQLWLIWLGAGVIGGIGLGIGYISPVSLLIKWFPDRRGMATGLAIMGFGGGAIIGAPLANYFMYSLFGTANDPAIWASFMVLGVIYAAYMTVGSFCYRLPPLNWLPPGYSPPQVNSKVTQLDSVPVTRALHTPQFWLLWLVILLSVTSGIGILGLASNMIQEIFGGDLIGLNGTTFLSLTPEERASTASIGAGFIGLLSLGNIIGRIFWSSLSDWLGRRLVFFIIFGVGAIMYLSVPLLSSFGIKFLFVFACFISITIYGGAFATIPAYIADLFGTQFVGAIHGRLLTAWSVAGLVGTFLIPYIHRIKISDGMTQIGAYSFTLYAISAIMSLGLLANWLIKPVNEKHHLTKLEWAEIEKLHHHPKSDKGDHSHGIDGGKLLRPMVVFAWSLVLIPLLCGLWFTLLQLKPLIF